MGGKETLKKKLGLFKMDVSRDFPIEKMVLFGSRATGKTGKNSDIDLIIVSPSFKKMNFIKRAAKMYDYWKLEYPVDFLCYTPDEFNKKKNQVSIVSEAVKYGVDI